ncbi:RagB/SusD family nutrient uptake outer membrane protein [Chryseobacterium luquanense]|uniref:RagB/SusD family nutrient uptake outer membrane protein n=1 Tax=Chryseobacterium luquanense TaxID=2983766 RepID=A0ABT3XYD6_9FLAO|nr:RagB/SusD family nutrient uptake outer membrane protein [Chryseobacterium luquanense]MCX8530854.1 RagB/SusD family nutrient uptake outer membrane protein [Chryseobacterium luquanense]
MKITIHNILITGILSVLTTCISCEKMLEVDMPTNQINSDQIFENIQTANAALSGLYAGLYDNSPLSGDQTGRILALYTDELNYYQATSNTGIIEIYQNTLIDSNPLVNSYWTNAYQKIYMSNAILEGVENSTALPSAEKERLKGEALTIRSILFFYLQQVYGNIPYPVTTNYMINQTIEKTPTAEVLQRIESDLKEAVPLLNDSYRNVERIFLNRKSAQLFLAKVLMTQKKWNEAEIVLKEIRQSSLYVFQNDITKVFEKSGTHIIWQLKPKNNTDPVKEMSSYYFANAAPLNAALTPAFYNIFDASDKRRLNWITPVTVGSNTWYRVNKYKNTTNNTTEYSIVLRLEEVYLLLAEALAQQDKTSEALPLINAVRQRANISVLTLPLTKEALLSEILLENRKEFFTEFGHRFMDLKRNNQLTILSGVKTNWKTFHQVWPIPQKELLLNNKLNPQNEGY